VLVDGGSKDNTMEVIGAWQEVLPITFAYRPFDTPGKQKNYALHHCSGEWVLAIDADHTFGTNMGQIYASGYFKSHPIWDFRVYVCVVDECHTYSKPGGLDGRMSSPGHTTRLFRSSYRYQHDYHEQVWAGERPSDIGLCESVPIFEHCLLQTKSALKQRGLRWQVHIPGMVARGLGPGGPDRYLQAERTTTKNCIPLPPEVEKLVLPRDIPVLERLDEYRARGLEEPPPVEFWEEGYGF